MLATGVLGSPRRSISASSGSSAQSQTPPPFIGRASTPSSAATSTPPNTSLPASLGLSFDPYDHSPLPARIISTGAAANFPSVSNLVGDVFNAPVFVPNTQVDSAQIVPHRNAPVAGYPGRAALGGAYVARWVWGREWGVGGLGVFEDEIRRLLQKRWIASGGVPLRTNVGGVSPGAAGAAGGAGGGAGTAGLLGLVAGAAGIGNTGPGGASGSGANSGTSTPFGSRSGVGATLIEEDEEDLERGVGSGNGTYGLAMSGLGGGVPHDPAIMAMGGHMATGFGDRMRTHTGSTVDTLSSSTSSLKTASTAYTTPDITALSMAGLNISLSPGPGSGTASNGQTTPGGSLSGPGSGSGQQGQTNPTPLTPVIALPTSDSEAQIGLAKVAEPDTDAFLTYAAIVPEFCRLEGMLVKGIV